MIRKTYKELEEQIRELKIDKTGLVILFVILFCLLMVCIILYDIQVDSLKDQLSECQDDEIVEWKCPILLEKGIYRLENGVLISPSGIEINCQEQGEVWTLKVECFNLRGRWIDQENYTKIDSCLHFRNVAESWGCKIIENCEVLK